MKNFVFIVNPAAGKIKNREVADLIKSESNKFNVKHKIFFTEYRNHAKTITQNLTESNEFDTIVAVGGDGTVNEVVNGFNLNSHCNFGILPFGSGNDVGRYVYGKGNKNYFEILFDNNLHEIVEVDVGFCRILQHDGESHERKFINAVGIGFDAYVAYLNQYEKRVSGIISYILAVFKALKSKQSLQCEISIGKETFANEYLLLTIGNGKTSGGGFYLNPTADPTDGILNLTAIDSGSRFDIVKNLPYALLNKLETVKLANFYNGSTIKIKLNPAYYIHLDGEIGSENAVELEIGLEANKLKTIKS